MLDHEEMLIRVVSAIEMHNLAEILPTEVGAWWDARKAQEEADIERGRTEALKFCDRQVRQWKDQQAVSSAVKHIED